MTSALEKFRWGDLLEPVESRVVMSDDDEYKLASIRRRNGGFFHRETKRGEEILTKTLSAAAPGAFAISKMQVVHGACAYVPEDFGDAYLSASYVQFVPKDPCRIDTKYLHYFAHSAASYSAFLRSSHGVHIEKMTFDLKDWLKQWVHLPPLGEQERIAEILGSVDDVIEQTRTQIAKLQDLKTATMNELLTKGIGHTEFKDTELGQIPASWSTAMLQDCSSLMTNGFVGSAAQHYRDDGIPYLVSTNIRANRISVESLRFISHEFHEKTGKSRLVKGDLLTVQSGHVGTTAVVEDRFDGANCHALILTRPIADQINGEFVAFYMNSQLGSRRLSDLYVGSTILHLNTSDLKKFRVPVPSLAEQSAIVEKISSVVSGEDQLTRQLEHTELLKKSLMQDLLTGKVRVSV